jgi:hypothetical protein
VALSRGLFAFKNVCGKAPIAKLAELRRLCNSENGCKRLYRPGRLISPKPTLPPSLRCFNFQVILGDVIRSKQTPSLYLSR